MASKSELEQRFLWQWQALGGPPLEREYHFVPGRRFRADFAHPQSMILIEIEGGVWRYGRHNRPQGYIADCEKYNLAAFHGWRVFRLAGHMIDDIDLYDRLIALALEAEAEADADNERG